MPQCPHCDQDAEFEENGGLFTCTECGQVVEGQHFSSDVTFTKGADGESAAVGQYVSGGGTGPIKVSGGHIYSQVDSHERSLAKGRDEIEHLVMQLQINTAIDPTEGAHRLYRIALDHKFTRGRRVAQVAGACLYIYCRQEQQPFMLIDIADILSINVFTLGSVFLQLCHVLRLESNPMFTRPVDPSLYIHRFVYKLLGADKRNAKQNLAVTNTALQLVKSMKRDWMQTGRRPSGICGAALFIAVHLHGLEFTRREIIAKIHIGEATLAKRVSEFATTAASSLTKDEFDTRAREQEAEQAALLAGIPQDDNPDRDPARNCVHIGMGFPLCRAGMCFNCYKEYLENTGGQAQGHNPPAFTQGLLRTAKAAQADANADAEEDQEATLALPAPEENEEAARLEADMSAAVVGVGPLAQAVLSAEDYRASVADAARQEELSQHGTTTPQQSSENPLAIVPVHEGDEELDGPASPTGNGSATAPAEEAAPLEETLSDVDMDMDQYIVQDDVELRRKQEMWCTVNKDWLEAQELKQAQLQEAHQARTEKMAEEEAKEAEGGRKRGRGRPLGSKTKPKPEDNIGPSENPTEAVTKVIKAKKLSSKVDQAALDELLAEHSNSAKPSKKRKVGDAVQERKERQAEVAAQKRARQQQALAADKTKQRSGSGGLMGLGPGLRSGSGKSSNLHMLGKFRQKTDDLGSPSRFRPTSPRAAGR